MVQLPPETCYRHLRAMGDSGQFDFHLPPDTYLSFSWWKQFQSVLLLNSLMTTKIPKPFWTKLIQCRLQSPSYRENIKLTSTDQIFFTSANYAKVRLGCRFSYLLPWWQQLIHSLNAPLPSSAPAPDQLIFGLIGMIGCGDLRFSASVLCIASCNVGFRRRSRCLIKSAFLSIPHLFSIHNDYAQADANNTARSGF